MEEKEILYKGAAIVQKSPKDTIISLVSIAVMWLIIIFFAKYLPFEWVFELGAIIISAILINKLLNKGTFTKTYILYEDELVVMTRYGFIEKESSIHPLATSEFTEKHIVTDGVKYPFYPDKELIKILKEKTAS